jgi:periplasmic protein TonB
MSVHEERQKKIKAGLATLGVTSVVFLILLLTSAWKTAGEGEGNYPGIEVNLGYDDQGSGNIQPQSEVGNPEAKDTDNPAVNPVEEQPKQETPTPTTVEEKPNTTVSQTNTVTDPNSDVAIKEEKKDKPVEKPVDKKPVENPEKPVEKVAEQPKVDQKALYAGKSNSNPTTKGGGEGKKGEPGNEGDDVGKTGDKGVEGGVDGALTYKGRPGGGDGGTLEIEGWDWPYVPKPPLENETGRIVFTIKVDENGDVTEITKESSSLSPMAEQECRAAIEKLAFTKKPNAKVKEVTTGRITFTARAQ